MKRMFPVELLLFTLAGLIILQGCLASMRRPYTLGDEAVKSIQYIATARQKSELKKLDTYEEVEKFLQDFWADLDPTPGTPENELKQEYDGRVGLADELFGKTYLRGSQTDRGRVYIQYGSPAEIYLAPMLQYSYMTSTLKSMIIWEYDLPAGRAKPSNVFFGLGLSKLTFIFGDFDGFGEYTLVYSTGEGDVDDTRLMMGPMGSSRAKGNTTAE